VRAIWGCFLAAIAVVAVAATMIYLLAEYQATERGVMDGQ
jgi:hypothetical protein